MNDLSYFLSGGGERDRTDALLLAKQALYQLSYAPTSPISRFHGFLVGRGGLEPPTPRLSSVCSNQLSYQPEIASSLFPSVFFYKKGYLDGTLECLHSSSLKGGDPAAGSPTATLLRLHPSHRPHRDRLPPLLVSSPA